MLRLPPRYTRTDTLCPYTTRFRSDRRGVVVIDNGELSDRGAVRAIGAAVLADRGAARALGKAYGTYRGTPTAGRARPLTQGGGLEGVCHGARTHGGRAGRPCGDRQSVV